jgi:hypothetical protein
MIQSTQAIRERLCHAIAATLRLSGRKLPEFRDTDKPLKDYEGFDSQCGLEVTVELEVALGVDDFGNNVFVKGAGKSPQARSLSEIVGSIVAVMTRTRKG